jgi:hypothetical protein
MFGKTVSHHQINNELNTNSEKRDLKILARSKHLSSPPSEMIGIARATPSSSHRRATADRRTA